MAKKNRKFSFFPSISSQLRTTVVGTNNCQAIVEKNKSGKKNTAMSSDSNY